MSGEISAAAVKELRERTGAGMMDCKAALQEADGDMDKAIELLRVKGQAKAAKRGERAASEGLVASYVHHNGKVGALVEVELRDRLRGPQRRVRRVRPRGGLARGRRRARCTCPRRTCPRTTREAELRVFRSRRPARASPRRSRQKIAEGRMKKWLEETVLLNQRHINADKHDGQTIEELRAALSASTGENVVVRRFARFQIGSSDGAATAPEARQSSAGSC